MINKKINLIVFFIMTLSIGVNAAQQTTPNPQQPVAAPTKGLTPGDNGGTYRDEVEIMKFDEYTGRDSYAIPFDEDALEQKQESKPVNTK